MHVQHETSLCKRFSYFSLRFGLMPRDTLIVPILPELENEGLPAAPSDAAGDGDTQSIGSTGSTGTMLPNLPRLAHDPDVSDSSEA